MLTGTGYDVILNLYPKLQSQEVTTNGDIAHESDIIKNNGEVIAKQSSDKLASEKAIYIVSSPENSKPP